MLVDGVQGGAEFGWGLGLVGGLDSSPAGMLDSLPGLSRAGGCLQVLPCGLVMFRAGGTAMRERAHSGSPAGSRPAGDAWVRVRREISDVAGRTPGQVQRWWLGRAGALLRYHAEQSLNPAYRELVEDVGVDPAGASLTPAAWGRVPVIDKQWLAQAGYDRRPACPGPVLVMGTSGSTAAQVLVPVTAECANRGLGDNFLRALALAGAGPGQRHWGIEHRPPGQVRGETGSSVSMTWLARHCGDNALVTVATDPVEEQLRRAAAFQPDTISGSPGFLQQIARAAGVLRPVLLLYGGAGLMDTDASRLRARFPGARLAAFYPTTDAGALGIAPSSDGVYRTFTETHVIEVLDDDGRPVAAGCRGDVVVTQFGAWAAPIIRYRVGDRATYLGWDRAGSSCPASSGQRRLPSGQRSSLTVTCGPGRPGWRQVTRPSWRSSWYAGTRRPSSASSP